MHVGVFPITSANASFRISLPHARGGVSCILWMLFIGIPSSPCTWGCFYGTEKGRIREGVFPMHMGCFRLALFFIVGFQVFPMHVGVFLRSSTIVPKR